MIHPGRRTWLGLATLLLPMAAAAHSFGKTYTLPVPVWLYLYGAAAALALSFVMIGYFVTARPAAEDTGAGDVNLEDSAVLRMARRLHLPAAMQALSMAGLLLCIVTGFFGTPNPYGNFNMTFFWVVFVLGMTYLTALAGDVYALVNPWRLLGAGIARVWRGFAAGRLRYPPALGYWPALGLYMAFIWIELFGKTGPFSLAVLLSAYTAINLAGTWLIGSGAWFRYCEFFSVFFRLVATLAPVDYAPARGGEHGRLRLRPPLSGLLREQPAHISLLVFVLFMLASTAFDGLHGTEPWRYLFWVDLYHAVLADHLGHNPFTAFPQMLRLYGYWQTCWLLASPFVYLAVYLLFIWLSKLAARSRLPLRTLALRFTLPLLPIALAYNITHYYTLIQTQGIKILALASDPFGRGWDLFGTAHWFAYAIIPSPGTVWHVQVALIVLGHIVAVYAAHKQALATFDTRGRATLSQLPVLALMVAFTTSGLWILAQPIAGG